MDEQPKFIVTKNLEFRQGLVARHKDLLIRNETKDDIAGGGLYNFDKSNNKMYFYGKSIDYGRTTLEMVSKAIAAHVTKGYANINCYFLGASITDTLQDAIENAKPLIKYSLDEYDGFDILVEPETNKHINIYCYECGKWYDHPSLKENWTCYCGKEYKLLF